MIRCSVYLLFRTPLVKCLVVIEDQIHTLRIEGFKAGVRILPFQEVINLGRSKPANQNLTPIFGSRSGSNLDPDPGDLKIVPHSNIIILRRKKTVDPSVV